MIRPSLFFVAMKPTIVFLVACFSLAGLSHSRADEPATPPKEPYRPYVRQLPERTLLQSDRDLIDRAVPTAPVVKPKQRRNLLVFGLNIDYDGHRSVVCAEYAFRQIGFRTRAFDAFVSSDPTVFEAENLRKFDAVVFNNTVGNLFQRPDFRRNLEEFVQNGGGLLAVHGASEAFIRYGAEDENAVGGDDWPVFGEMIGARGMKHRETDEQVFVRIEAPEHPLTQFFPRDGFSYKEEILRFGPPFSREKQQVLLSLDNARSNLRREPFGDVKERDDEDYALVWIKTHGKGRCCYSAFGHNPRVFWDPMMLKFYLAATQFVLGDLDP